MQDAPDAVFDQGAADVLDPPGVNLPAQHRVVTHHAQVEDRVLTLADAGHGLRVADVDGDDRVTVWMGDHVGKGQLVLLGQPRRDEGADVAARPEDDDPFRFPPRCAGHCPPPFQAVAKSCSNPSRISSSIRNRGFGGSAQTWRTCQRLTQLSSPPESRARAVRTRARPVAGDRARHSRGLRRPPPPRRSGCPGAVRCR